MFNRINNKFAFYITILIYVLLTLADVILTYVATPDLVAEGNPLVTVHGFGWGALLIAQAISFIVIPYCVYLLFTPYERKVIQCKNFYQFTKQVFTGTYPNGIRWYFHHIWQSWARYSRYVSFLIIVVIFVLRIVAIIEWSLIIYANTVPLTGWWHSPLRDIPFFNIFTYDMPLSMYVAVTAITAFIATGIWYAREYKINKRMLNKGGTN